MKIINNVIDYSFLSSFDIKELIEALVIPIRTDSIYFVCFVCGESNVSKVYTNSLIKSYELSKEEILFFLSDIKNRVKLFELVLKSKESENINHTFIEEFLDILIKNVREGEKG